MEFEWLNAPFDLTDVRPKEIEESFEDPFSIRILPDVEEVVLSSARYFILGKSVSGQGIFSIFWTDGKRYRVIFARQMTPEEDTFYERKNSEMNY